MNLSYLDEQHRALASVIVPNSRKFCKLGSSSTAYPAKQSSNDAEIFPSRRLDPTIAHHDDPLSLESSQYTGAQAIDRDSGNCESSSKMSINETTTKNGLLYRGGSLAGTNPAQVISLQPYSIQIKLAGIT